MSKPRNLETWSVAFPAEVRVRPASRKDRPLLLYLHGMGESAASFEAFWPRVGALDLSVVAPSGPFPFEKRSQDRISIGHAWYLYDGGDELFRESSGRVEGELVALLKSLEVGHGLTPRRRILLGYSMGAYFGYLVALRNQDLFTHMVGVSGNLKDGFMREAMASRSDTRCLVVHGEADRSVPADFARKTDRTLREYGFASTLRLLPGGHGLRQDRDEAVAAWLARELELSGSSA